MSLSLADILAPITPAQFFAEYHGKTWLHIPGTPEKFAHVMSLDKVDGLLSTIGLWNPQSLQIARDRVKLAAEAYTDAAGKLDGAKVKELLIDGASLVLNDVDLQAPGLTGIDEVARTLETALEGKVQANLYSSPRERQAFASHFDAHDVYAVHVEGEKLWRIYEGRRDLPIEHESFMDKNAEQADEAKGKLAAEVLLKPGDLLYLPRGQYHDALARTERTVHIAFGVVGVIGMDVISALYARAMQDRLFRADLPRRHGQGPNSGPAAFAAHIAALGRRMAEFTQAPDVLEALQNFQDAFRFRAEKTEMRFGVTADDFSVVEKNGQWLLARGGKGAPIPPGLDRAVAWIVAERRFTQSDLARRFPLLDDESCGELLRSLAAMKVIEPV